jgi:probable HAF family extracellular repeat protein
MNTNLLFKIVLIFLVLALIAPLVLGGEEPSVAYPDPQLKFATIPNVFPMRMNNTAWRVGYALSEDLIERAVLWTPDGARELLPLKGNFSCAYGVNDEGTIVGQMDTSKVDRGGRIVRQAFLWRDDVLENIDHIRSFQDSAALDINRHGWVAGWIGIENAGHHAALWTFLESTHSGPKIIDLGTLGGPNSIAHSINGFGLIVGQAEQPTLTEEPPLARAFRYEYPMEVKMTPLPSLVADQPSAALDVNDAGVIVGWAQNELGEPRAVAWKEGKLIDLGDFGGTEARAYAINSRGLIVGMATLPLPKLPKGGCFAPIERAFVVQNGTMIDLNTLIAPKMDWLLLEARDINDRNEITGYGWYAGDMWGFTLTLPATGKAPVLLTPGARVAPGGVIKH